MYGWTGKILNVDLSNAKITELSTEPYDRQFLGGRGIGSRIYWERVSPEVKAFDPENRLILMNGTLVATGALAANRMTIIGKSPMTLPEGFCYSNFGGYFPAEVKKAGYDGIVFEGCAAKPVYLWINDGQVEIRDASVLWGQGAYKTGEILEQIHGKDIRLLTTGVAGENMVRTAVIFGSHQGTATAGFGAVMGSKKLKAIAVRGSGKPALADANKLVELNRYTYRIHKRVHITLPSLESTPQARLFEVLGKGGCYQCGLTCSRNLYRYDKRLEGIRRCQSMEYYLPWKYQHENEPIDTMFDAPTLANNYSICTFELENTINWLYACYRSGVYTDEQTGLPLAKIGTREFLEKLLHAIAYREGFGDVLAEGLIRAREKVPEKARELISPWLAAVGSQDIVPPRAIIAHAIIYPMEPRSHPIALHEISWVRRAWVHHLTEPDKSPLSFKVMRAIAKAFWGSAEAGDLASYEGKALAALKIQNRCYIKDSLGLCDFNWPITYSFNTPDHVGDPNLEAEIFAAVTGMESQTIDRYGDRIFNQQRLILLRESRKMPEADYPPEFNFTTPLGKTSLHGKILVPGPGDEPVDATGNVLDRNKFKGMLQEYYQLRGWDDQGIPRAETLAALGLDDR